MSEEAIQDLNLARFIPLIQKGEKSPADPRQLLQALYLGYQESRMGERKRAVQIIDEEITRFEKLGQHRSYAITEILNTVKNRIEKGELVKLDANYLIERIDCKCGFVSNENQGIPPAHPNFIREDC